MAEDIIIQKLNHIEKLLSEQSLLQKQVLNFNEACQYLDISQSHLYKLTSTKQVPHFCPQGKRLYFKRTELDEWLQRNRKSAADEIDQAAADYIIRNKRRSGL
ncbi:MAG TPA: helix-turn-helix domain-containing protein [Chitinophagaceae bacterium]|nr:helix-turn-helix domain-containing protein [Chitinophagaceae bacterium]